MVVAGIVVLAVTVAVDEGLLVERLGEAQLSWSARTVSATGRAEPPAGGSTAWRSAEAAAHENAEQKVLGALRAVRLSGQTAVGTALDGNPALVASLTKLIKSFKASDTKYYSDGGVDVVLVGPLGGPLVGLLVPQAGKATAPAAPEVTAASGVVVSARGLQATPALAPRLYDEAGKLLYDASMLSADGMSRNGVAAYYRSLERASRDARVGGAPLVVKALRPVEPQSADLVISGPDAERLSHLGSVLAEGRVAIVVD
jgi:hypothetical protein